MVLCTGMFSLLPLAVVSSSQQVRLELISNNVDRQCTSFVELDVWNCAIIPLLPHASSPPHCAWTI